ncbi:unnamed protein product, partial [Tetraodon nigroviridis]
RAVLLLGQAAVFGPCQRRAPAAGLPAHAGALGDVPREPHAHRNLCPGNHHPGAPRQRSAARGDGGPHTQRADGVCVLVC